MALLRHGGLKKLFIGAYAPSTLGSFLRAFKFGHVRQLDAVASRWLKALTEAAPIIGAGSELALVDIDDTIKAVYGYQKEGAGYGYSGVRGLNALIGVLSFAGFAPVIIRARLRKGACNSARGAKKFVADILATTTRLRGKAATGLVLLRADSAFYAQPVVAAAARAGAFVSITVRMNPDITRSIGAIPDDAWETIQYTNADAFPRPGPAKPTGRVCSTPFTGHHNRPDPSAQSETTQPKQLVEQPGQRGPAHQLHPRTETPLKSKSAIRPKSTGGSRLKA